jgi:hypothetical protein|tara:strand:- start:175 stop:372 length:198 start_codon:yes stop_codon:yes gene_type:complete
MTRIKALEIVKNMERTITTMTDVDNPINDQFPPARPKKTKLISIQEKLIEKYDIKDKEYKMKLNE